MCPRAPASCAAAAKNIITGDTITLLARCITHKAMFIPWTCQQLHGLHCSAVCSRCTRAPVSCGMCAKNIITGDTITADILKLAELEPDELLYWSHDNTALSHLPYMICLDK